MTAGEKIVPLGTRQTKLHYFKFMQTPPACVFMIIKRAKDAQRRL